MESFFSSLKTERVRRKVYRTRDQARADVFDDIERFYNPNAGTRRSATSAQRGSNRPSVDHVGFEGTVNEIPFEKMIPTGKK
jgi:hypothetical protein